MNMQLKGIEAEGIKSKEVFKEDRKDDRTKIQATQQSELIDQRKIIHHLKTLNRLVMI
jgi:hypothetical protein